MIDKTTELQIVVGVPDVNDTVWPQEILLTKREDGRWVTCESQGVIKVRDFGNTALVCLTETQYMFLASMYGRTLQVPAYEGMMVMKLTFHARLTKQMRELAAFIRLRQAQAKIGSSSSSGSSRPSAKVCP